MKHYTKVDLQRYEQKEMGCIQRWCCTAHLRKCQHCMQLLNEIRNENNEIASFRNQIQFIEKMNTQMTQNTVILKQPSH